MIEIGRKREKTVVGLEIEAGSIAAVEVHSNGSAEISRTAIGALPAGAFSDGEVADLELLSEALGDLFSEHKLGKRVRLGVANQRVVVRAIRLPAIENPDELDAAVRFEAQEQIPMPIDQVVLDHRVIGGVTGDADAPPQIDVIIVAARREMIEASLAPLRKAGLEPIGIDLSAFGLIRALGESVRPQESEVPASEAPATLYCNIGEATNLAIARGRACLFTRVAPAGLSGIVTSLGSSTDLTPEHALMWVEHVGLAEPVEAIEGDADIVAAVRSALEAGTSSLEDELRLSLDFYGTQEGAVPVERVVLSGLGSNITGLAERLGRALNLPVETGRLQALRTLDAATAARLTLSYGLALED
jgi:type IV pilus assembly protein PilM